MSKFCNDNSKETNAYQEFLNCNNILVITLPSRFLTIISKYNPKRPNQKYRLYTDLKSVSVATVDAVLVDNGMTGYYEFAKYVKPHTNKGCKFFVLVNDKYITDLQINHTRPHTKFNNKRKDNGKR